MRKFRPYLPAVLAPVCIVLLLVLFSGSVFFAKKSIGLLLMPLGLLWLSLIAAVCLPGISRPARFCLIGILLMFSLAGNLFVSGALLRHLQGPYEQYADGPNRVLDAVLVLGAGTEPTPGTRIGLSDAGDRVHFPVILFRQGKIRNLVTSGRGVGQRGRDRLLSEETRGIWIDLGIPSERIFELSKPRNTREEITAFKALLETKPDWTEVGVCSSASHLPRALGIAKELGFDPAPVPANFRARKVKLNTRNLIPNADAVHELQTAMWEIVGILTRA